ncbi:MAG: hypothetical protein R2712_21220 [Vicinamibacterales bacterium]
MDPRHETSAYRVEKLRSAATLTLSTGERVSGCFFLSPASAHAPRPERVGELLNEGDGFFPFEVQGPGSAPRAVLLNREQILTAALTANEIQDTPGYDTATQYLVSIGMANGPRLMGTVRVYSA